MSRLLYYYSSHHAKIFLAENEEELVKVGSRKGVCSRSTIPRPVCLIHSAKCDLQVFYLYMNVLESTCFILVVVCGLLTTYFYACTDAHLVDNAT